MSKTNEYQEAIARQARDLETLAHAHETATSVYSGKPGCCCGCLGEHRTKPDQIGRVITQVRKAWLEDPKQIQFHLGDETVAARDFIAAEVGEPTNGYDYGRVYIIYFDKDEGAGHA